MNKYYYDKDAGNYKRTFPLAKYSFSVKLSREEQIRKSLKENIWFNSSTPKQKDLMIQKLRSHEKIIGELFKIISSRTKKNIRHISIGGSYLFDNRDDQLNGPHDIDYNVLVSGSYFDYFNYYETQFLQNIILGGNNIKKVSFMMFGENNIFEGTAIEDSIKSEGYMHTDLAIREGLIFSWRNGTIYGKSFGHLKINRYNLLIRIARELYQAKLFLKNKIALKKTLQARQGKALSRVSEVAILLKKAFPEIDTTNILDEKLFNTNNIMYQYENVLSHYFKAREVIELAEGSSFPKNMLKDSYMLL